MSEAEARVRSERPSDELTADGLKAWIKNHKERLQTLLKAPKASSSCFADVQSIAERLLLDTMDQKAIDSAISDVVLPVVNHNLGQTASADPIERKKVSQFLLGIARTACRLFKQPSRQSADVGRLLRTAIDPNRAFYREVETGGNKSGATVATSSPTIVGGSGASYP